MDERVMVSPEFADELGRQHRDALIEIAELKVKLAAAERANADLRQLLGRARQSLDFLWGEAPRGEHKLHPLDSPISAALAAPPLGGLCAETSKLLLLEFDDLHSQCTEELRKVLDIEDCGACAIRARARREMGGGAS